MYGVIVFNKSSLFAHGIKEDPIYQICDYLDFNIVRFKSLHFAQKWINKKKLKHTLVIRLLDHTCPSHVFENAEKTEENPQIRQCKDCHREFDLVKAAKWGDPFVSIDCPSCGAQTPPIEL